MNIQNQVPSTPDQRRKEWEENFNRISDGNGFFEELGPDHKAVFVERGSTLVVTFDNLDDVRQDPNRMPWGMEFMTGRGRSCLGLMAHGWTWYRDENVFDFFDLLKEHKFFDKFENVVFYGGSMGGYAAAAFSAAAPGSHVLIASPQATLERELTAGWETRYKKAWSRDFTSRYGNAADMVKTARKVTLMYDPTFAADAMHAAMFKGDNIRKLKCRFMGHRLMSTMRHMGILSKVVDGLVEDTMTDAEFYKLLKDQKRNIRYQKALLGHLAAQNRPDLVRKYCTAVINDSAPQRRPHFVQARRAAIETLRGK
ncbi:MAG: hypothetical protein ACWA40_05215 [Planktomarina sp.]